MPQRKPLVLLDFNGALVLKNNTWGNKVRGRRPDFVVPTGRGHSNGFFLRPFARKLVRRLLNDPRCDVAIYTSMVAKNVKPVAKNMFIGLSRRFRAPDAVPFKFGPFVQKFPSGGAS